MDSEAEARQEPIGLSLLQAAPWAGHLPNNSRCPTEGREVCREYSEVWTLSPATTHPQRGPAGPEQTPQESSLSSLLIPLKPRGVGEGNTWPEKIHPGGSPQTVANTGQSQGEPCQP